MWISIIGMLAPLAGKLLLSFIENKLQDKALADDFKSFMTRMQQRSADLANARDEARKQRDELGGGE